MMEEEHVVGDLLDDAGVVFDDEQCLAFGLEAAEEGHDFGQGRAGQAGGGLVQEKEVGAGGKDAGDAEQFLFTVGQIAHQGIGTVL